MEPTRIITARVPAQVYHQLKAYTKQNKISVNKFIQRGLIETSPDMFRPEQVRIKKDISKTLIAAAGGSLTGVFTYKLLKNGLTNSKFNLTTKQIDAFAYAGGLTIAVLTIMGLEKLLDE